MMDFLLAFLIFTGTFVWIAIIWFILTIWFMGYSSIKKKGRKWTD